MSLRQQLEQCLHGRVCLIGLGSREYGDDQLGVLLARALASAGVADVLVAEANPERFLANIAASGYDNVVFLDAVELGAPAGSLVLLDSAEMLSHYPQLSTHKISLGTLARVLESNGMSKAWLLGVQPESIKPGAQLSATIQTTLTAVLELVKSASNGRTNSPMPGVDR